MIYGVLNEIPTIPGTNTEVENNNATGNGELSNTNGGTQGGNTTIDANQSDANTGTELDSFKGYGFYFHNDNEKTQSRQLYFAPRL